MTSFLKGPCATRQNKDTKSNLLPAVERGRPISLELDGERLEAHEGETVAAALIAAGRFDFGISRRTNRPMGLFCGMGVCYECMVTIDGVHGLRACVTEVREGMHIETRRMEG